MTSRFYRYAAVVLLWSLSGCVFVSGNFNPFGRRPEPLEEHVVSGEGRAKVLLIDIAKIIGSEEEEGAFGVNRREGMTARIREQLDQAAKDDKVRAVVLRINSPGGTVTASDTIYHQIMEFKSESNVPVVAQMLDMGT